MSVVSGQRWRLLCMRSVWRGFTRRRLRFFCYDSVDSGGGIVSYYELDDDEGLGEFSEGRDLYDPFCGEHGCRYDVDDHCFSDGLAVDVQAETDVSV